MLPVALEHAFERPALGELELPELPDRLEHHEPDFPAVVDPAYQRLVDKRREAVQDGQADRLGIADFLGRTERPPAAEDRQAHEELPLRLLEQLVAPLDRRAKRSLPLRERARSRRQQPEAVDEPDLDLLRREHLQARGRELDREG